MWPSSHFRFAYDELKSRHSESIAAAIDRLVHHSVIIELNVPSYRVEKAKTNFNSTISEAPDKNS